jgi:hypothetical protein
MPVPMTAIFLQPDIGFIAALAPGVHRWNYGDFASGEVRPIFGLGSLRAGCDLKPAAGRTRRHAVSNLITMADAPEQAFAVPIQQGEQPLWTRISNWTRSSNA